MFNLLLTYWWIAIPAAAAVTFFIARLWSDRVLDSVVEETIEHTQSDFSEGSVEIHEVTYVDTTTIDDETMTMYSVDADISPTESAIEWTCLDLFLYGIDDDGSEDRMRMGEVTNVERWNGSSFERIDPSTMVRGSQRMKLTVNFVGASGPVRFNYNFGCFGSVFHLPEAAAPALTSP